MRETAKIFFTCAAAATALDLAGTQMIMDHGNLAEVLVRRSHLGQEQMLFKDFKQQNSIELNSLESETVSPFIDQVD